MRSAACRREPEVVEAVMLGRWPVRADDDLRTHVDGCVACRDAVELAAAFAAESAALETEAGRRLADGRVVWWRAQMRARQEARRVAVQPIVAAGVLAIGLGAGVAAGLAGLAAGLFGGWVDRAGALAGGMAADLAGWPASLAELAATHTTLALTVGTVVALTCLAPVVCYFTLREE